MTENGYQTLKDALRDANKALTDAYVATLEGDRKKAESAINRATEAVEIAEGVWSAMGDIADGRDGPAVAARLDSLGDAYAAVIDDPRAMMQDALAAEGAAARREAGLEAGPPDTRTTAGVPPAAASGRARRLARRWVPSRLRRFVAHRRR